MKSRLKQMKTALFSAVLSFLVIFIVVGFVVFIDKFQ